MDEKTPAKMHRDPFMCQTPQSARRTQRGDKEGKEKERGDVASKRV